MKLKILAAIAIVSAALLSTKAAPNQNPTNFLGGDFRFIAGSSETNIVIPPNVDFVMIPRSNISPSLTAAQCTGDVRTLAYFMVRRIHDGVNSLPSTNTFRKLTVGETDFSGTVSNLIRKTFSQTFTLDGSAIAPAGE